MKPPEGLPWLAWRLCLDHEGNMIRNINEVLYGMTLEQVLDAHEAIDFQVRLHNKAMEPKAKPKKP